MRQLGGLLRLRRRIKLTNLQVVQVSFVMLYFRRIHSARSRIRLSLCNCKNGLHYFTKEYMSCSARFSCAAQRHVARQSIGLAEFSRNGDLTMHRSRTYYVRERCIVYSTYPQRDCNTLLHHLATSCSLAHVGRERASRGVATPHGRCVSVRNIRIFLSREGFAMVLYHCLKDERD